MNQPAPTSESVVIDRLVHAANHHDLEAIVDCFAKDYRNETPAHPARGFVGREQVRRNWMQILGAMPDITVTCTRAAAVGDTIWTEQEHRGTRPDGRIQLLRGVIVFGVDVDEISWARFYMEPVDDDGGSVDEAIARQLRPDGAP